MPDEVVSVDPDDAAADVALAFDEAESPSLSAPQAANVVAADATSTAPSTRISTEIIGSPSIAAP